MKVTVKEAVQIFLSSCLMRLEEQSDNGSIIIYCPERNSPIRYVKNRLFIALPISARMINDMIVTA